MLFSGATTFDDEVVGLIGLGSNWGWCGFMGALGGGWEKGDGAVDRSGGERMESWGDGGLATKQVPFRDGSAGRWES